MRIWSLVATMIVSQFAGKWGSSADVKIEALQTIVIQSTPLSEKDCHRGHDATSYQHRLVLPQFG